MLAARNATSRSPEKNGVATAKSTEWVTSARYGWLVMKASPGRIESPKSRRIARTICGNEAMCSEASRIVADDVAVRIEDQSSFSASRDSRTIVEYPRAVDVIVHLLDDAG